MRLPHSIRWRLQAWHGLMLAVLLGGLGATAFHFEKAHQRERMNQNLQQLAGRIANALRPQQDSSRETGQSKKLQLAPEVAALFGSGGKLYYAIWLKNGAPLTVSPSAPSPLPRPPDDESGLRTRDGFREAYFSPAPGDCVLVGEPLREFYAGLWRLAGGILGAMAVIFVAAMVIGNWLVQQALRPVEAISETATRIAGGDLSQRIDSTETESELGGLARILNTTFDRLDAAFARQARFTADAAHELRTPVAVLLTHLQNVLSTEDLSEENREALEACQRAAQRMRRLIESLLQLARFDGGQELLQFVPCDLAAIVREGVELIKPLAELHGVTLHAHLIATPFLGDPDRISQVVTNLLANAIHYNIEQGEVHVSTCIEGRHIIGEVANTGPGIAPDHLPHVFERFYRADKARRSGAGKAGLGLAISQSIVEAHGGKIEATSEEGKRTVFTMRLPCAA